MLTWVIGSGGLLGAAIARTAERTFDRTDIPWSDPSGAIETLREHLRRFVEAAQGSPWAIAWAAGAMVVASSDDQGHAETETVRAFAELLSRDAPPGPGAFFFASSAGGVYAGSASPPFDETTTPAPLSAYGQAKLEQEEAIAQALGGAVPVVIGRLSNLYGPGQALAKRQGLVSHLCLAAATRQAINLYVPMETLRDYLHVDDAASMVRAQIDEAVGQDPGVRVKNLAYGRSASVGEIVSVVQHVAHRPVRVALSVREEAKRQPRDLRISSTKPTNPAPAMPLAAGVKGVYEHTLSLLRDGRARTLDGAFAGQS